MDGKVGMESVSAEFLSAQSILETLRENSKMELSFLKDILTEKDLQLKVLHDKQKQIDRDQKELIQLEAELNSYKSHYEHLQQALEIIGAGDSGNGNCWSKRRHGTRF